jgi:hypothetical protein
MALDPSKPIGDALKLCVKNMSHVYYMNGNHGMAVKETDLGRFSCGGNKIEIVTPDWYEQEHKGTRRFEHGHAVDMFNAPVEKKDTDDTIGGYPLGYFITRLSVTHPTVWEEVRDIFQKKHDELHAAALPGLPDEDAVRSMFDDLAGEIVVKMIDLWSQHGISKQMEIVFEPKLDKTYTVGDLNGKYERLCNKSDVPRYHGCRVSHFSNRVMGWALLEVCSRWTATFRLEALGVFSYRPPTGHDARRKARNFPVGRRLSAQRPG